ncbi:cytochrome P450 [Sistotremastrum suecicum HHB10207 ss-3]|uniref:Cytochrome P450 n=1 Tax=Sistotremastrum suecicum HHB10207 ss-3 TaxID=1314776 RepID=A0A166FJ59_9AGAM|nr:cytochrome P450 [Sistotremastrum suecicum HHB10207 ss-3]
MLDWIQDRVGSFQVVALVTALVVFKKILDRLQDRLPFPPGPKGIPWVGNVLQMPLDKQWMKFADWAKIYGPVVGLKVFGKSIILLDDYESASDLLDSRGAIYSSRPDMPLANRYGGFSHALTTLPYGDLFHLQRKFMNRALNPSAMNLWLPMIAENARAFALNVLESPDKIRQFNRMYAGSNILMMAYGYKVDSPDDPWILRAHEATQTIESLGNIGAHPIDIFPILGNLPFRIWGKDFVTNMATMKRLLHEMSWIPYNTVKQQFFTGSAPACMVTSLLEENAKGAEFQNETSIIWASMMAYGAGADTTVAALDTFIIAMMLNPKVQKKAQAEIDNLLQGERLPALEDRQSLPYLEAILKEVHRWQPVAPLGLPHAVIEDDEYNGMHIPAGSMIIFNLWSMLHNSKDYPDPESFNPDRYIREDDGKIIFRKDVRDPEDLAFGFGRRLCPGRHFASASLWLATAMLLTVFDISLPVDEAGNPILPDLDYENGIVSHPKPYKCVLKPRSENSVELLSS